MSCQCRNNFTKEDFVKRFGDDSMVQCNKCENLTYDKGTLICEKFENESEGEE